MKRNFDPSTKVTCPPLMRCMNRHYNIYQGKIIIRQQDDLQHINAEWCHHFQQFVACVWSWLHRHHSWQQKPHASCVSTIEIMSFFYEGRVVQHGEETIEIRSFIFYKGRVVQCQEGGFLNSSWREKSSLFFPGHSSSLRNPILFRSLKVYQNSFQNSFNNLSNLLNYWKK